MNATRLLDSLGVNTHFAYSGTPYVDRFDEVCAKLTDLEIKHIRDGGPVLWNLKPDYMAGTWDRLLKQPCDLLYVLDAAQKPLALPSNAAYPYAKNYGATDIGLIRNKLGAKVIAWEGLNEPDQKIGAVDWAAKTLGFQQAAYRDLGALAQPGQGENLLTPAIGHPWDPSPYSSLGFRLWDYGTHAAAHLYAGKEPPENPQTAANLKLLRRYSADLPIWVTECGYQTVTAGAAGSVAGAVVSEADQARYLLRTVFHHLDLGLERTYFYELIDAKPAGGYGLLRYDLSEKPSYVLLKALLRGLA